jgi:hypothetical protein
MNPGITLSVHFWRGFGGDAQSDLFYWRRFRLGFVTLAAERQDPLRAYRGIRQAAEDALNQLNRRVRRDMEGR